MNPSLRVPDPNLVRVRAELEVEWWLRDFKIPYNHDLVSRLGERVADILLNDMVASQTWEAWLGPVARSVIRSHVEEGGIIK